MIADKMVTVSLPNIEFERRTPKLIPVNDWCVLATAGDALIHSEILQRASEISKAKSVEDIAHALEDAYVSERLRLVDELILKPIGLSVEDLQKRQQEMRPEVVMNALQQMGAFQFDFVILLAGVDESGAHIYAIRPPGNLRSMDAIGYWAIGSGELHALQTFVTSDFDQPISVNRALLVTYEAKKRAEKATGVGSLTDIWIVKGKKIRKFTDDEIQKLEEVYQEKTKTEAKWLKKIDDIDLEIAI